MEERLERHERLEALQRNIAALPEKQAAALLLCHFDGLSYRDAAEALGVSESAIKSLIHRAREGLTRAMNPYLTGPSEVKHALR
jgi:RNA polymerase sigma-70 factor (ECF subfamily)